MLTTLLSTQDADHSTKQWLASMVAGPAQDEVATAERAPPKFSTVHRIKSASGRVGSGNVLLKQGSVVPLQRSFGQHGGGGRVRGSFLRPRGGSAGQVAGSDTPTSPKSLHMSSEPVCVGGWVGGGG